MRDLVVPPHTLPLMGSLLEGRGSVPFTWHRRESIFQARVQPGGGRGITIQ